MQWPKHLKLKVIRDFDCELHNWLNPDLLEKVFTAVQKRPNLSVAWIKPFEASASLSFSR